MIIGIDASRANRKQKTGVEWYSYHLIQELKKIPLTKGDKFILYSLNELKGELAHLPHNWQSKVLIWPFKYVWTQIRLAWEILINPPDLLFVPAHCLPIFCRPGSVITIHDLGFKRFSQAYSFGQRIYACFVHYWAVKKANQIITPSEFTKRELIELYKAKSNKITVIPEGYDKKFFYLIKDEQKINSVLKKYQIKKPYFLYVGRLEKKKNIQGLLKAYNKLGALNSKSPKLILVGKPGFGYQEIQLEISRLRSQVCQLGYVPAEDMVYLYNGAEAFIYPSFYEGFGLPVLEAMACGCPVLASNTGSIPEVGGQAVLYFSPDNPEAIAKAMKKIVHNQDLKVELREKGLGQVKNFSWQRCAQETMKTLIDVLK
ncbi:glycosyltransferase family 4 protein [Patescibacteria group bacterium]|nr:glycosyltransferase family 4 protein [Patescibacteria group bacterium]